MTLPASGSISLNQVNTELARTATASINMNDAAVRTLFGVPSGAISMSNGRGKSNRTYATFGDVSGMSLSGGNLVATSTTTGSVAARSNIAVLSGKRYVEFVFGGSPMTYLYTGVQNASITAIYTLPWDYTNASFYYGQNGVYSGGGGVQGSAATWLTGDVMGLGIDRDGGYLYLYKNGALQGSLVLPPGAVFPFAQANVPSGLSQSVTARFGPTGFSYSPPSGYEAGLYS